MPKLRVGEIELKELTTVGGRCGRASYNDVIPWTFCTYEYVTKEEGTKSSSNSKLEDNNNLKPLKSKDPSSSNRDQKTIPSYFNAIQEPTHITPRKSIAPSSIVQAEKTTLSNFTATIQEPSNIIPLSNTQRRPINLENVLETEAVIHKKKINNERI